MTSHNNYSRSVAWSIFFVVLIASIILQGNISVTASENSTNTSQNSSNASNLLNSSLSIRNSQNITLNHTAYLFAYYSDGNSLISGTCIVNSSIFSSIMNNNNTEYYYAYLFDDSGNYSYNINCNSSSYLSQAEDSVIEILPLSKELANQSLNLSNSTIDSDLDNYTNGTDCNDFNPEINPGRTEVLYNGVDDDCNPATYDTVLFEISTDKQTYNPQETVSIMINSTNNSDTYLTINTPSNLSYVYIFSNSTGPITQPFTLTSLGGTYSVDAVNYFGNYTNAKTINFEVLNTFSADIQVDKIEAYEHENIHFKAVFSGAIGQVNQIWRMDDSNERYLNEFDYNYSGAREYNVALIATDQGGNQVIKTKKITILKTYFMKVNVVDNTTGGILQNATVKLDSVELDTNVSGWVEFNVTNKTYGLRVTADNYYSYSEDIKLNNSLIFTVRLVRNAEEFPPVITLLSPQNSTSMASPEFHFKFNDETTAACTLFVSEGDSWWQEMNKSYGLNPGSEYIITPYLEELGYHWKIQCIDEDGNAAFSPEYIINVAPENKAAETQQDPETTYNVIQNVYDLLPDFETYSPDEKEIAEYLQLDPLIKDAKRRLEMANRDLFNLNSQPDTDSIIRTRDEIYLRIDQIKDETPQSLSVKDKVDFVKYVDDADIDSFYPEYLGLKNIEIGKNDLKILLLQNKELQKKATIQTNAYDVTINYLSGRTEQVTLIKREIQLDSTVQGLNYVELIPKEIAETSNSIIFITEPDKILKEDPIFELSLSKAGKVVYYIKDTVPLDSIPKIKPFIFSTNVADSSGNSITGFSVFNTLGFSESNKKIFFIEIIVVFILLGIYLFYYFRSGDNTSFVERPEINYQVQQMPNAQPANIMVDNHKLGYMGAVIKNANELLNFGSLKDAAVKYYELKFLYDLLDEASKNTIYQDMINLADNLNYNHMQGLLEDAIIDLATGKKESAGKLYEELKLEYEKLSDVYKDKIYPKCCELALHLKGMAENEN